MSNAPQLLGVSLSRPSPLGLTAPRKGNPADTVNAAVFAPDLEHVVLCYQVPGGPWAAVKLAEYAAGVHHGVVEHMPIGSRYGYRAEPGAGAGIEPETEQLLLDPYGRFIDNYGTDEAPLYASVRMDDSFDWGNDTRPHTPWRDTIVYEAHVRGQSMLHPDVPEDIRGSYAGIAHEAMIRHLKDLGVTAIELLPIHFHLDEPHLEGTGMTNYWGYNSLGFFSPQTSYASPAARAAGPQAVQNELKGMVKLLHAAGIEVILDVVFNHTAEGAADRPAVSWRGLAERTYYRNDNGNYIDTTGCGNTLDFSQPRVIQLALDSLRYWVRDFHIDGFRFDLAVTLGRDSDNEFNSEHPFLLAASTDSQLDGVKLISEPWDLGYGGWQTGRFPQEWHDWNDHFRDYVRQIWLSDAASLHAGGGAGPISQLADALSGSAALFGPSGRSPLASVNFVTAHDGFTLADLTAYDTKHNEANGEDNRDGSSNNHSWNHGVEGPTTDPAVNGARAQSARNLMATLLLSLGVPMITAGDEMGRSQGGNNNAYCQDNEITWLDWNLDEDAQSMLNDTRSLIRIRKKFLASQPASYLERGESDQLRWFGADGELMTGERWSDPHGRVLQMFTGTAAGKLDGLIVFNASLEDVEFHLPKRCDAAVDAPADAASVATPAVADAASASEAAAVVPVPPPAGDDDGGWTLELSTAQKAATTPGDSAAPPATEALPAAGGRQAATVAPYGGAVTVPANSIQIYSDRLAL
nr:glycogen debranching protein GlgX [Arthrobacter sp. 35W]